MTEEEAKTKWCPHVRIWSESGAGANRDPYCGHSDTDKANCIAADCMAWRWTQPETGDRPLDGYCGLAGAPS